MGTAKTIKVACRGSATLKLSEITEFQGNLKELSAESSRKLRKSLLRHGVSFPFFIWKSGDKHFCLDGHQRLRVLHKLANTGYHIPPLPIDLIDAKDEKEAKEKILLIASQYGQMTDDTLMEFLKDSDLNLDDLQETIALPDVDIQKLLQELEAGQAAEDAKDGQQYQVIVECGDKKEQRQLIAKLKRQGLRAHAITVDTTDRLAG